MAKHINCGFFYYFVWHSQFVLPKLGVHPTRHIEMFQAKIHNCIILLEKISFTDSLIFEYPFAGTFKSGKANLTLCMQQRRFFSK